MSCTLRIGGFCALLLAGCGARSGLETPDAVVVEPPVDAGPLDAGPLDAPPLDADRPPAEVCIELPPREPPRSVEVAFVGRISNADVHFLIDSTGSMSEEIEQIRVRLVDTIVPGIVAQIPDVRFSVARFADYPISPYGNAAAVFAETVYQLEQASTTSIERTLQALERIYAEGGGDGPEALVPALHVSASGLVEERYVPPRSCPPDTVGYPCFGRNGSRIFVVFTDAVSHNGPDGSDPYDPRGFASLPPTYDEALRAMRDIGAKVLGLYSGFAWEPGQLQLERIARDTGAVGADGAPIVFDIGTDGAGLGERVVEAVRTLVEEVPLDVDVVLEDEPDDGFDATEFVTGVVALRAEPAAGATVAGDRFLGVRPGTRVTFSVRLANERIERGPMPVVYRLRVVLRGDGSSRLTETVVDVVIPSLDGRGCAVR